MDLMQTMMMQCMQINPSNNDNISRRPSRQSTSQFNNPSQCKYCWTHRWCKNHFGRDCQFDVEENRDVATRDNRIGGSTRNIFPQ